MTVVLPVTRLPAGSTSFNTLDIPVVKFFFQRSPGKPRGDVRGIQELEFRVRFGELVVNSGVTGADGRVDVPLLLGSAVIELLVGGEPVATYEVEMGSVEFEPVTASGRRGRLGQQQRLRMLGYQIGHGGPDGDGVGDIPVPPNPLPPPPANLRRQDDHHVDFDDLNFATERSILDFQADMGLVADGRVGSQTGPRLDEQARE